MYPSNLTGLQLREPCTPANTPIEDQGNAFGDTSRTKFSKVVVTQGPGGGSVDLIAASASATTVAFGDTTPSSRLLKSREVGVTQGPSDGSAVKNKKTQDSDGG